MRLKLLEILVVCQLHLMTEVDHLREILLVVDLVVDGILDAAVEIDGEHALRTGGYASGTEGVAEPIVLNLITQAAAARQRVGIVAHIGEEGMSLAVHLGCEVAPLLVDDIAVVAEQGHRLDGEGENGLGALLVKPLHESLL